MRFDVRRPAFELNEFFMKRGLEGKAPVDCRAFCFRPAGTAEEKSQALPDQVARFLLTNSNSGGYDEEHGPCKQRRDHDRPF